MIHTLQKFIEHINFEVVFAIIGSLLAVLVNIFSNRKTLDLWKKSRQLSAEVKMDRMLDEPADLDFKDRKRPEHTFIVREESSILPQKPKKSIVLKIFAILIATYLIIAIILNWDKVIMTKEKLLIYIGLFLIMCGGMFVSVISKNYTAQKSLFDVTDSDLLYPLLFSVFVFYPLLIMVDTEQNSKLLFYTAFMNGYFWKTIVTEVEKSRETMKN